MHFTESVDRNKARQALRKNRRQIGRRVLVLIFSWAAWGLVLFPVPLYFSAWVGAVALGLLAELLAIVSFELTVTWFSPARRMKAGQGDTQERAGDFCGVLREVSQSLGLSALPRVYVVPKSWEDAQVFGLPFSRLWAMVVTDSTLRADRAIQRAVVAHELAHIRHKDIISIGIGKAAVLSSLLFMPFLAIAIAHGHLAEGFLPAQSLLLLLAYPSYRLNRREWSNLEEECEYAADARSVLLTDSTWELKRLFEQIIVILVGQKSQEYRKLFFVYRIFLLEKMEREREK